MKKHFVIFLSPGTIVSEKTSKPIESWDVEKAKEMARGIEERHGATPYGFYFTTRERSDDELDSKLLALSGVYYLGGKVEQLAEIKTRNDPSEKILRSNMEINSWDRVITNTNSWKITLPLFEKDVVLEWNN
jgi:hypothetical protein